MSIGKSVWTAVGAATLLLGVWVGQSRGGEDDLLPLRIGYTDHMLLITALPDFREAQQKLAEQNNADQEVLQEMYATFQGAMAEYEAQRSLLTDELRGKKENELVAQRAALEKRAAEVDAKLNERQVELLGPLYERVDEAIKSVAKRRKLDLVLRAQIALNEPSILYADESRVADITREVADELGLPDSEE